MADTKKAPRALFGAAPKASTPPALRFAWQLTPDELAASWQPSQTDPTRAGTRPKAFACAAKKLDGTKYKYQLAVGEGTANPEMQAVAKACPDMPRSGDKRSGVVILDGDKVIGALTILGVNRHSTRSTWVDADYRGKGIATRMLELWYREVPRFVRLTPQRINVAAAKAYLKAHEQAVVWAASQGKDVPSDVTDAIASGEQRAKLLARFGA